MATMFSSWKLVWLAITIIAVLYLIALVLDSGSNQPVMFFVVNRDRNGNRQVEGWRYRYEEARQQLLKQQSVSKASAEKAKAAKRDKSAKPSKSNRLVGDQSIQYQTQTTKASMPDLKPLIAAYLGVDLQSGEASSSGGLSTDSFSAAGTVSTTSQGSPTELPYPSSPSSMKARNQQLPPRGVPSARAAGGSSPSSAAPRDASSSCIGYTQYASNPHEPYSEGPLKLPFQRPAPNCRTFTSPLVEKVIDIMNQKLVDPDLARLFENCFPNTLDTTIRWHTDGVSNTTSGRNAGTSSDARTFIVTGDINAEWIRDSQRQLLPYLPLASKDERLRSLIAGVIHQYVDFLTEAPYCNAFNPPKGSGIEPDSNQQTDTVFPNFDPFKVFECKYELDSIASFFALANQYFESTGEYSFVDERWINAAKVLLKVIKEQQEPTYDAEGNGQDAKYSFQRNTNVGTETLPLSGEGNPVGSNTSLVRSAFRPSDDATIFQLFIPANAQLSVELRKAHSLLSKANHQELANEVQELGMAIGHGVWEYGTHQHRDFGKVFAYEVDGFGGLINLDDANLPSLLALPDMGFCDKNNRVYQNTRRMILSKTGNPYYLSGKYFSGIGSPHTGIKTAWPMSHLIKIRTTDNDEEIKESLKMVLESTSGLGLIHESIHVDIPIDGKSYTRPWFAWANAELGITLLDLALRKPHLIFKPTESQPWRMHAIWKSDSGEAQGAIKEALVGGENGYDNEDESDGGEEVLIDTDTDQMPLVPQQNPLPGQAPNVAHHNNPVNPIHPPANMPHAPKHRHNAPRRHSRHAIVQPFTKAPPVSKEPEQGPTLDLDPELEEPQQSTDQLEQDD